MLNPYKKSLVKDNKLSNIFLSKLILTLSLKLTNISSTGRDIVIFGFPSKSFLFLIFVYLITVSFQYLNKSSLKTILILVIFDIL